MIDKRRVDSGQPRRTFSNGFLFVSGQVASNKGGSAEPDLATQVRLAFANLNVILAEAGSSFDDIVDTTTFMVDFQPIVAGRFWRFFCLWPRADFGYGFNLPESHFSTAMLIESVST